ncbi:hypothetical protein GT204_17905 [Streptomyces sp. SID4919]|uniref:hypothetical protein n=1 Tax=unclassified Streptomyces TaxID=2593676 RepID=UPI000C07E3EE|nr:MULTISPECIES: hypothetical protein [unclassified Streptomyces]MYY10731.1 hypothetical protein [Streptomyces sp. SID4919]
MSSTEVPYSVARAWMLVPQQSARFSRNLRNSPSSCEGLSEDLGGALVPSAGRGTENAPTTSTWSSPC